MKCSVFIATSLDGYIARADGRIDWLEEAHRSAAAGEDFGYQEFFDGVDVLILGRKTFETVRGFPEWPYGEKRVVVLSQTLHQLPADCPPSVRLTEQSPAEIVKSLERESFQHAYVDGGSTIQSFLAAGLVSDLTITTIPILLGSGLPLFGRLTEDLPLLHEKTRVFPNGFVQSKYRVR